MSIYEDYDRLRELLDVAELQIWKLRAALKPFAEVVYNDNGDITLDMSDITRDNYREAYYTYREVKF